MKKRLKISLTTATLLGIICIIGIGTRKGFQQNQLLLIATWYNRILIGLIIGLAAEIKITKTKYNKIIRGLTIGLIVTLALSLSTAFFDKPSFIAGIIYGGITDYLSTKYS